MEDLKTKEEILSEYFLVETEKTEEIKGWKVVGTIEGCAGQSVSPLLELKTDGEGWLCDFKIKLLHCGLILASPEYVIDEDELVMEAMEKVWKVCGVTEQLQKVLDEQLQEKWKEIITQPYYPDHGTWTTTTTPIMNPGTWTNTITCDANNAANYIPAIDYCTTATCATTAVNDYATATCTC